MSFKHNNKKRELSSYSLCGGEDAAAKKSKLFDPDNDTHVSASDALEYFEDERKKFKKVSSTDHQNSPRIFFVKNRKKKETKQKVIIDNDDCAL